MKAGDEVSVCKLMGLMAKLKCTGHDAKGTKLIILAHLENERLIKLVIKEGSKAQSKGKVENRKRHKAFKCNLKPVTLVVQAQSRVRIPANNIDMLKLSKHVDRIKM